LGVNHDAFFFFDFVDVPSAERLLPGHWVKETERGGEPDSVVYYPDNSFERQRQAGLWSADEGDFYTNLLEFAGGSNTPSRLARIISISPERVLLNEVSSRAVISQAYRREEG